MNILNIISPAPSSLPPASVTSPTPTADSAASLASSGEPSAFAKILQQRQSANKPTPQTPGQTPQRTPERTASPTSPDHAASAATLPPSAQEPKNVQSQKATASSKASEAAAAQRSARKQPAATAATSTTEMERLQPLSLDDDPAVLQAQRLDPESSTHTMAQGLTENVALAVANPVSPTTATLAAVDADATSTDVTATTPDAKLLSDSRAQITPSTATSTSTSTASSTPWAAEHQQPAQPTDLPSINLAPSDLPPTATIEQLSLMKAKLASPAEEHQHASDLPRPLPETNSTLPLTPPLMPMWGDALKGLALLNSQDKPHRQHGTGVGLGDTGPLPSWTAASTALMAPPNDATPHLVLASPVNGPQFKEALATQVVMLIKDGIQQASLQLNPAHMGPISIQISLEGTQTRVDFASDSALTRQIIEAGLPELAGALREAGLTLSGGGVSQQSSQSAQQDTAGRQPDPAFRTAAAADDEPAPTLSTPLLSLRMNQGGLDLYA